MVICYECEYRGEVPGDAHSCCKNSKTRAELGIKGNDYGIRRGWFFWPSNFDPVWLENCDGFSQKGRK
jgi:hypothetical protein